MVYFVLDQVKAFVYYSFENENLPTNSKLISNNQYQARLLYNKRAIITTKI